MTTVLLEDLREKEEDGNVNAEEDLHIASACAIAYAGKVIC